MPTRRTARATLAARLTLATLVTVAACLVAPPAPAFAEPPASRPAADDLPALFDPDLHMLARDVEVGMTGHGLTVFQGTQLTRFDVEVVGVLRNTQQVDADVVLIRATGGLLDTTGPIQGMSGSPIYLTGRDGRERLVGAFAFGWPFSKETLIGVQPIEAMLRLREITPPTPSAPPAPPAGTVNLVAMAEQFKRPDANATRPAEPAAPGGGLTPLQLPLQVRGGGAAEGLRELLANSSVTPTVMAGVGVGRSEARTIEAGMPLVVPILTGDLELSAVGTATAVIGDQVFAFGHPLFDLGSVELPMAAGTVDATIPLQSMSFKIGTVGEIVGTLHADATSGVAGTLGPVPQMADLEMTVRRGDLTRTFSFQATRHPAVITSSVAAAVVQSLALGGGIDAEGAARYRVSLEFDTDDGPVTVLLGDVVPGTGGTFTLAMALQSTLQAMTGSPFGEAKLAHADCDIVALPPGDRPTAFIAAASVPRKVYAPGATVPVVIALNQGPTTTAVSGEIRLPDDLPEGPHTISILTAGEALSNAMMAATLDAPPRSVAGLAEVFSQAAEFPNDSIYLRLERPDAADLTVDGSKLPNLPASVAGVLSGTSRTDIAPVPSAVTSRLEIPFLVLDGSASVEIIVRR